MPRALGVAVWGTIFSSLLSLACQLGETKFCISCFPALFNTCDRHCSKDKALV